MAIASPPTGVTNAELVRWAFEQINRHDVTALREIWSADIVVRFPDRTCRGVDEVAGYFEDTFAALPDVRIEAASIVEQGDDVFARWRITGTQNGPVQGIEGTGKSIDLDGIDHFVLRDGRIVSNFVVFDQMQYSRQLGTPGHWRSSPALPDSQPRTGGRAASSDCHPRPSSPGLHRARRWRTAPSRRPAGELPRVSEP